mmetsp:Transcript_28944/g.67005  ORF Transcript_28944/g.67005 Transcript_28944/m.67005 type:complete len:224 (+) Transcript_28944:1178-1849(+)
MRSDGRSSLGRGGQLVDRGQERLRQALVLNCNRNQFGSNLLRVGRIKHEVRQILEQELEPLGDMGHGEHPSHVQGRNQLAAHGPSLRISIHRQPQHLVNHLPQQVRCPQVADTQCGLSTVSKQAELVENQASGGPDAFASSTPSLGAPDMRAERHRQHIGGSELVDDGGELGRDIRNVKGKVVESHHHAGKTLVQLTAGNDIVTSSKNQERDSQCPVFFRALQ